MLLEIKFQRLNPEYTEHKNISSAILVFLMPNVSEGGEEVKMGEITYVKLGETYFQPIQENGKDMYEVADVEDDK